jgi:hypothetical protein
MYKHCPQLKKQLQELKSLFSKYCLELEQVKTIQEYESIFSIQDKLKENIDQLMLNLYNLNQNFLSKN